MCYPAWQFLEEEYPSAGFFSRAVSFREPRRFHMARVALISPPYLPVYMRNARCDFVSLSKSSWYPIWLGQAGAWLEGKGHKTRLLDAQILGMTTQQAFDDIEKFNADIVAVYTGRLSEANNI